MSLAYKYWNVLEGRGGTKKCVIVMYTSLGGWESEPIFVMIPREGGRIAHLYLSG